MSVRMRITVDDEVAAMVNKVARAFHMPTASALSYLVTKGYLREKREQEPSWDFSQDPFADPDIWDGLFPDLGEKKDLK